MLGLFYEQDNWYWLSPLLLIDLEVFSGGEFEARNGS